MAKVIAPFILKGILDDLEFYNTQEHGNLARELSEKRFTAETLQSDPRFEKMKNGSTDFAHCSKKARVFHKLVRPFNKLATGVTYISRVIRMFRELLDFDTLNPPGSRSLVNALQHPEALLRMEGFESNLRRPLPLVLKTAYSFDAANATLLIDKFNLIDHLDWPETATHVQFQLGVAQWDVANNQFQTHYSSEMRIFKYTPEGPLMLAVNAPKGKHLLLHFLSIAFYYQEGGRPRMLASKYNTTTLLSVVQGL